MSNILVFKTTMAIFYHLHFDRFRIFCIVNFHQNCYLCEQIVKEISQKLYVLRKSTDLIKSIRCLSQNQRQKHISFLFLLVFAGLKNNQTMDVHEHIS